MRNLLIAAVAALSIGTAALAQSIQPVTFAPGTSGAVLDGRVMAGENNRYGLDARAGQRMSLDLAGSRNAVFTVYEPSAYRAITTGAVRHWEGRLPSSGVYVIEVGSNAGNAGYSLNVHIR